MATILPYAPPPHPPLLSLRRPSFHSLTNILPFKSPSQKRDPFPIIQHNSSPPSEDAVSPQLDAAVGFEENPDFRGCKTCGREEIEKGCNGEGRIQGGIATVRGFGWWPIKAFRPCPGFVASGGRYKRYGQSLDEVAFGRTERDISVKLKAKSS